MSSQKICGKTEQLLHAANQAGWETQNKMSSAFDADERFTGGCTDDYNQEVAAACRLYGNEIQTIAILGAGVLGKCVVTELAFSGVEVNVYDRSPATLAEVSASASLTDTRLLNPFAASSAQREHPADSLAFAVRVLERVCRSGGRKGSPNGHRRRGCAHCRPGD